MRVVVALGHHATAVLGNDDALVEEVTAAGEITGERCWRLPLWDVPARATPAYPQESVAVASAVRNVSKQC